MNTKAPSLRFVCTLLINMALSLAWTPGTYAQEDEPAETISATPRERIVIKLSHIPVSVVEAALRRVSEGTGLLVIGEPESNKLVIDAPTSEVPNALGLIRELDRQQPMVNISVKEVLVAADAEEQLKSMPTKQIANLLKDLAKSGNGKVVGETKLSTMSNATATSQIGANKPRTSSRAIGGRGGQITRSVKLESIGTLINARPAPRMRRFCSISNSKNLTSPKTMSPTLLLRQLR